MIFLIDLESRINRIHHESIITNPLVSL